MFKMLIGAGLVVVAVGFGVITTEEVQTAGSAVARFVQEDAKPAINNAASKVVEATK